MGNRSRQSCHPACERREEDRADARQTRRWRAHRAALINRQGCQRKVAAICFLAIVAAVPSLRAQRSSRPAPNVVMILMDDMGYSDIGSYGVKDAKTPNVDRLAREGVRLVDAYANASNCSPTRAGFITGQYQQRYGIDWPLGSVPGDSALGLRVTGNSLPALLKKSGYATGPIGKWHFGCKPVSI